MHLYRFPLLFITVFSAALLSVSLLLSGCQAVDSLAPSRSEQGPQIESVQPDILSHYNAYYIPDIQVYSIEGDILRKLDQNEVKNLVQDFRTKLIRQLGQKHTVFSQPARNVAIIKIIISDVSTTYALFQLYPGMLVPNAMRGGASIEAKVLDSITGEQLVHFRDTRQGQRQGFLSGLGKWDGAKKAFDEWASQLGATVSR